MAGRFNARGREPGSDTRAVSLMLTRRSGNRGEYTGPGSRTGSWTIPKPRALSRERSGSPRDSSTRGQTKDSTALGLSRLLVLPGPHASVLTGKVPVTTPAGRARLGPGRRSLSWLSLGSHSPPSYQTAGLYLTTCFQGHQIKAHAISERQSMKSWTHTFG